MSDFRDNVPSQEEVEAMLKGSVPSFREAIPEVGQIVPRGKWIDLESGAEYVHLAVADGANEGWELNLSLPIKDAAQMHPDFACCDEHHEAAMVRMGRILASPFN